MELNIYWILDLEDGVHSTWVIRTSNLQECKGNFVLWSRAKWAGSMGFHRAVKESRPWQGLALERCDIAQGVYYTLNSVISRKPTERLFVVQISLLSVTFFSLISWILSLMETTEEINPHPQIASICRVASSSSSSSSTKLHYKLCNITCFLIATCVILRSLECIPGGHS